MQKMHTYDSVSPLSSRVRFVQQNLVSSESLLRIVVNKSHYPKFLVNYPFVPLTAFLDISESVVWNESGTNHESRTNQEHWNESGTPPPVENDPPPVENDLLTPPMENDKLIRIDPLSGNKEI